MRKMISFLLVAMMTLSMSLTAMAAGQYTITINNSEAGHTYEAYQIFAGKLDVVDNEKVLSDITWGSGVTEAGKSTLGNAQDKAETITTAAHAQAFALQVADYLQNPATTNTVTDGKYKIAGLEVGYYLVKDADNSLTDKDDSYTAYILCVVESVSVDPKADAATVEKKVKDINDSTETDYSAWMDSADYDIGDVVKFKLTADLPNDVAAYDHYKVVFHDTLSAGLTYNNDAVITVGNSVITDSFTKTYEGTALTFACNDVKAAGAGNDSQIIVEYTATLNSNAVIGSKGNPNAVYLEYSNNQYKSGETDETNETGKTAEDTVIVFTYKVEINKVDEDKEPLTGAQFHLEKYNKTENAWHTVAVVENEAGTTFTFNGIDDGIYRLEETDSPGGYNPIEPIYFTVKASHDIESDNPQLLSLSAGQTDEAGAEITTGIVAQLTGRVADGVVTTDIVNQKGSVLPSTGGMGTTMLYAAGFVLFIGAGVLLVTKKRMKHE